MSYEVVANMTPELATDILTKRVPSTGVEWLAAKLVIALWMVENYQIDIRDSGLVEKGFCQGRFYTRSQELLDASN